MKRFKQLVREINEELSAEEVQASGKPAMLQFNKTMKKYFPEKDYTHNAGGSPMGGGVSFLFAVIPRNEATKTSVSLLNAPSHSKFMMHLTDNRGKWVPMSKFSIEQLQGRFPGGVKFRKITAGTPEKAVEKFTDWFRKHKGAFEIQRITKK